MIRSGIVKEFREYGRYAALASLSLSGQTVWLLYVKRGDGLSVIHDTYVTATTILFCVCGLVMGLASTLADLRRGHWGFVAHRPASRMSIFAAKFLGLAALYVLTTSVVVVAAGVFASQPRWSHGPFALSMMGPTLFAQGSGLVCVACGMLIAARRARWVGTRLFPAVAAVATIAAGDEFAIYPWQAAVFLLAGLWLLLGAGAAYFAHNGRFESQPRWAKPLSAFVVALGAAVVLIVAANVPVGALKIAISTAHPRVATAEPYDDFYSYIVGPDLLPYRLSLHNGNELRLTHTAQGAPLTDEDVQWARDSGTSQLYVEAIDPARLTFGQRHYFESFQRRTSHLREFFSVSPESGRWWYVNARRQVEGFTTDGDRIGTIGVDGFHPPGEAARPFPVGVRSQDAVFGMNEAWMVLTSDTDVYVVNARSRMTWHGFHTDAADPVCGVGSTSVRDDSPRDARAEHMTPAFLPESTRLVVLTRNAVTVVSPTGTLPVRVPVEPFGRFCNFNVAVAAPDAVAVMLPSEPGEATTLITSRAGRSDRLVLPGPVPRKYAPQPAYVPWLDVLPTLLAMPPAAALLPVGREIYLNRPGLLATLVRVTTAVLLFAGMPMAIGIGLTWLAVRHRAWPRRTRATWLAAAAVLGPVVPLTLICLRNSPARLPCPACGRRRPVDAERCPHCAAAWPMPADPATDVIERAAA